MEYQDYQSYYYALESSQDIDAVVAEITSLANPHPLIFLASYRQNTVLFHNLKMALEKQFPNMQLHILSSSKENPTELIVFSCHNESVAVKGHSETEVLFHEAKHNLQASSDHEETKKELLRRFFLDSLTQLPNHYQLRQDLDSEEDYVYIVIHIDNFKLINDFYGFLVGDFLLENLANTLKSMIGSGTLYKTTGAEFAILMPENKAFYELETYLKTLHQSCKDLVYHYHDNDIFVDLTFASSSSDSKDDIFSKVSMALQYAKTMRLPYWIYEDSMAFKDAYESNLRISIKIREAIKNSGIVPFFQPIISNKTGEIVKFECLA
ncbi:MAG TPA: diguanylate cyclase, partial [Helicobacteraceae bacterium]|nr:diguanylate cyclase [Helicobacteraceae bacterium]